MAKPVPNFLEILRVLTHYQVDFIVVGGVCAVLQGAPIATFDLDIVHSRKPENLDKLITALEALEAYYRVRHDLKLKPTLSHLSSPGHQLLMTRYGPLDVLGAIGKGHEYDELIRQSIELDVGESLKVRLLTLEKHIQIKEEVARDQDKAVLPILRRTLEEKSKT